MFYIKSVDRYLVSCKEFEATGVVNRDAPVYLQVRCPSGDIDDTTIQWGNSDQAQLIDGQVIDN